MCCKVLCHIHSPVLFRDVQCTVDVVLTHLVLQVNATQMECRVLLHRTEDRVPNLNPYVMRYYRHNGDLTPLFDSSHKMRYVTKYAAKSGRYNDLMNEMIEFLSQRSVDILPLNMRQVLSSLVLCDCSHRSFYSKQELAYNVMGLPKVRRTFADVGVVGFYHRANLTESTADGKTIVYSDRTEYSAYAERCLESTMVMNRKNARVDKVLTKERVIAMNFREFAELVNHKWVINKDQQAEEIGPSCDRKYMTRDVNSGYWELRLRRNRRHVRFSTVLYTEPAHLYKPVVLGDTTTQTSFFSLPAERRQQLYRCYMELVCYVPWRDSPEATFIVDEEKRRLLGDLATDPEADKRYSLRRLEMFFEAYMKMYAAGLVAPAGSQWQRDNQYSYSMYLASKHNTDIHAERVENNGVLRAQFEDDEELKDLNVDIQRSIFDEVDESDYPSAVNFISAETFQEVMEQKPPCTDEISVAFPLQPECQRLEEMVMVNKKKLFMAKPPAPKVALDDMTFLQRKAVELGVSASEPILYLCGKAGSGKTEVALHICEQLKGRVQAGAGTGKAASNFNGPTVHGMFTWSYEHGYGQTMSQKKLGELRAFYENTEVFIVDEVNAMSAEHLAELHETMTLVFNEDRVENEKKDLLPFGGKKMVFLGDPAQLKPVAGEPIYGEGKGGPRKAARARGCRGVLQSRYQRTAKGQELYRKYIAPNCIFLQRGQRNTGLLQQICDRLRNGVQTDEDLQKLTFQRRNFPNFTTDYGVHYDNESCGVYNWRQLWQECQSATPTKRMYLCKASYHTTNDNQPIVDVLSALPPTKFNFAADVLCVAVGCDVRLIKNVNVAAGLVNSASGTVTRVIFNNADVDGLRAGKNPPPYCIIVDFPGFQGFPSSRDGGERVFPFPKHPHWVPMYRQKFTAARKDLPSSVTKKQELSNCYREQFPLDLSRHITTHRAQGQTLSGCTVSVDLGLDNPDRQVPPDIGSIIYVACTRVKELKNLFVGSIFPTTWDKIGQSTADHERRETEAKLMTAAREFAARHNFPNEMAAELDWQPNYSSCDDEWKTLQAQKMKDEPISDRRRVDDAWSSISDSDLIAHNEQGKFPVCMKAVTSERHIGIDQGRHNFAIVVVDKYADQPPKLVAAENYDLMLSKKFKAFDAYLKLRRQTDLWCWMQQTEDRLLPNVDRVVVHIEQMSVKNSRWKEFGIELGEQLQKRVRDVTSCIIKMSQPHIHRATGPMFKIGKMIVDELNLVPATYGRKRGRVMPAKPQSSTSDGNGEAENDGVDRTPVAKAPSQSISAPKDPQSAKVRRVELEDVEPSDAPDEEEEEMVVQPPSQYRLKKTMSAKIFQYFIQADADKQENLGINVDATVQETWMDRIESVPNRLKLDDLGDALLHALNELLCGGSNYKQLVPGNSALHSNRTVVVSVLRDMTHWAVLHCTWNMFELENFGAYPMDIGRDMTLDSASTVNLIKSMLDPELQTALTDMTGGDLYSPVEHIKIVVKQLKGFQVIKFSSKEAGALTNSTTKAMRDICVAAVGDNRQTVDRNDKFFGRLYIETNLSTGHRFQVMRSAGKQTSAILACPNWMAEHAKDFIVDRTLQLGGGLQLRFFQELENVASSETDILEMIRLAPVAKNKLVPGVW